MYENFISLGWYCGTANSMSKLRIRSYSGPFDWYFSSLQNVLECMDNNFIDFLYKKTCQFIIRKSCFISEKT